MHGLRTLSVTSLFLVASTAFAQDAPAAEVRTEILVVLASETEGAIDPALAQMPALRRPPFNAFHTMQVLGRTELPLAPGRPIEHMLPNGRALRIEMDRVTTDGRYRLQVSINTPGQTDYLRLLSMAVTPGEFVFLAGQNHQVGPLAGTLVIGVRVGQRPAARKAS